MVTPALVGSPSKELAVCGRAVFEYFNQTRLPRVQVHLCPGPVKFTFRCCGFIQVKRGGGKFEIHDGEILQYS